MGMDMANWRVITYEILSDGSLIKKIINMGMKCRRSVVQRSKSLWDRSGERTA